MGESSKTLGLMNAALQAGAESEKRKALQQKYKQLRAQALTGALPVVADYLKGLHHLPESVLDYCCAKCFGGDISFEHQHRILNVVQERLGPKLDVALGAALSLPDAERNAKREAAEFAQAARKEASAARWRSIGRAILPNGSRDIKLATAGMAILGLLGAIAILVYRQTDPTPKNPAPFSSTMPQPIRPTILPVHEGTAPIGPKGEQLTQPRPRLGAVANAIATGAESQCARARAPEMGEPLTAAFKLSETKAAKAADTTYYKIAAAKAEEATTMDPECSEAWSLLAYVRYRCAYDICGLGDYSAAREAANKALSLEPTPKIHAAVLRNMARIAAAELKWNEAERLLNDSLSYDPGNHDARSWLADLGIVTNPRPEFIAAVRKVVAGEIIEEEEIKELSLPEMTNLLNAPLARNGRRLNAGPADWFFFCDGSPLGYHLRVDVNSARSPVKNGTPDSANTQLITGLRKRLTSSSTFVE